MDNPTQEVLTIAILPYLHVLMLNFPAGRITDTNLAHGFQ